MATTRAYNVYVGSETGLLKGIHTADRSWQNLNAISGTSRSKEITCLCWGDVDQSEILAGLRDNTVLSIDANGTETTEKGPFDCDSGHIKALARCDERLVTAYSNGIVNVWHENDECDAMSKMETGDNLWVMCQSENESNIIATGGKENPLKLWDLNNTSGSPIFTAKNVRNDWLNLRVPVWVTRAAFLGDGRRIASGTGHHQVYVYDPASSQRRPVLEIKFMDHPVTALAVRHGADHQVVVGNTLGDMGLLDLRRSGKAVQLYKGFNGGITDIHCHASHPLAVSCSVDRFVRVHNLNDKALKMKFYLKSRLNCLLLANYWPEDEREEEVGRVGEAQQQRQKRTDICIDPNAGDSKEVTEDDDEVWDSLDVVKTKTLPGVNRKQKGQKRKEITQTMENTDALPKKKKKGRNQGKWK